ncbi:MAG: outer membrane protein transport protein [Geobacteraceae bacterium]|nr:outer membrane protein transport protein [Geobacteraceae bacterium]
MLTKFSFRNVLLMAFVCFTCLPSGAKASGFGIFTHGAAPLGEAAAVTAHGEEPSSVFYNPALINRLSGTQVEVGTTLLFPSREFSGISGGRAETKDTVFYPSTFFITHRATDRVSVGFGVFSPFGLGTDWGRTWEGRYIATNSELLTLAFNPVVSVRITPKITLAAGLDIIYLDTTLEKNIDMNGLYYIFNGTLPPYSIPDNGSKFSGDGTGVGFNIGFLYDVSSTISVGATYRSEVKIGVEGTGSYDTQVPPYLVNTRGKADMTLPQQVTAGISYKGFDSLTLEAGIRWEDWSSFRQLRVNFADGTSQAAQKNWKSTFAYNLGARYRLNENVSLLAGYLYSDNPVPDETFEPSIPDADTHLFCVGTELTFKQLTLSLSYAYQLLESRNKANSIGDPLGLPGSGTANGKYGSDIHMLAASLVFKY